ncbi:hypothetical protein ASD12_11935 [Mesorhizobium sp. Root102]|nr:hypothetical protein ASD12_11935 [Mesorhizobium sp. Root102]
MLIDGVAASVFATFFVEWPIKSHSSKCAIFGGLKPCLVENVMNGIHFAWQRLSELDAAARLDNAGQDVAQPLAGCMPVA